MIEFFLVVKQAFFSPYASKFPKIIPTEASVDHTWLKIRLKHPKNGLFSLFMHSWCYKKKKWKKIIFDVKNSIFEEKFFSEISIIWIGHMDDDEKNWELQLWEPV